jgi:phenylacetate-CoA ligase
VHAILAKPLSKLVNRLEGNNIWHYVPEVERVCSSSKDKILLEQWDRLLRMIRFAYETIPFYQVRFREAGITPESIQSPRDLLKIPPLSRDDIRRNQNALLNPSLDSSQLIETATGGTTDSPIHLFLNKACLDQRRAATQVFFRWFGNKPGDSMAFLWGAHQDFSTEQTFKGQIRQWLLGQTLFLPSSYLNDDIMWEYYKKLEKFHPKTLQAYPTPLYIFADFLERNTVNCRLRISTSRRNICMNTNDKRSSLFFIQRFLTGMELGN